MISASIEYEVAFFDVDAYRVVWHGHYPKYWEIARCHLLEQLGIPYRVMEEMGYFFPVVDMRIKYIKPLVFGQKVSIVVNLIEWQNRLVFEYQIVDTATDEVCTKAVTKQVAVKMPESITQFISPEFITQSVEAWLALHSKSAE